MDSMLKSSGLENILEIIHDNIKNPVVLSLSFSGDVYKNIGEKSSSLESDFDKDIRSFYESGNIKNQLKQLVEDEVIMDGRYIKRTIMPIILRNQIYGHIFSWGTDTPLGGFDFSIIESASTTIALFLLQQLSIEEVEIRYSSEYFEDLISSDSNRKKKALERAKFFDLGSEDYYLVEILSFEEENNVKEFEDDLNYMQEFSNPIVNNVEKLIKNMKLNGIVSTKGHGIQILLNFEKKENSLSYLEEFNEKLLEIVAKKKRNVNTKIGIGRLYKKLSNVYKSFDDALRAVRIGKILHDKEIVYYDELGIFKILSQEFLNDELEDFYETTLKKLVDYDKQKSTDLVKTLESYFLNNGNLTRISEELYTHYNTILYRIKRIEEITGVDLNNSVERLNLEIAIKIKELLNK